MAAVRQHQLLKYLNNVSRVNQLCSVKHVPNVQTVKDLPVGARLNQFWETWEALRARPKVVQMLKEGYTLPFQTRSNLTRSPTIISCYVHPHRNLCLLEALHQLTSKNAAALDKNQESLGFYNQLFLVPKQNKWSPILDLSNLNKFLKAEQFKMETPKTIRTSPDRGVGNIHRLQGCLLPHTNSKPFQDVPKVSCPGPNLPVQSTTIWSLHTTHGVHYSDQRGQTDGFAEGYKDPPIPRRLVGLGQIPPKLSPAYTYTSSYLSGCRLASQNGEIRAEPQTSFWLCRLPVRPEKGQGHTYPRLVAEPYSKDPRITGQTNLSSLAADVPHRATDSHRETGSFDSTPHEAHTVAPEKELEGLRVTRKGDTNSQVAPPSSEMVAGGKQCASVIRWTSGHPL